MPILAALGNDVDTVEGEGLCGEDDPVIWDAAQESSRFLITQDLDFSDLRRFQPGTHAGILLLRLAQPGRAALLEKIRTIFETENTESWKQCFVVATERKIRVLKP